MQLRTLEQMAFRADRLKFQRERYGYTQDELAGLVGVAQSQVDRWEKGQQPKGDAISNMAKVLNVTSDYLLGLVDDPDLQIAENGLSPLERKLVSAFRSGQMKDVLQLIVSGMPDKNS